MNSEYFLISFPPPSWCILRSLILRGRSDKWAPGLSPSFSHLSVPLTAWHLHDKLLELMIYLRTRAAEVDIMKLLAHAYMCSDSWYTRVAGCGSKRKMEQGR